MIILNSSSRNSSAASYPQIPSMTSHPFVIEKPAIAVRGKAR